jgi:hypothetical protein
MALLYKKILKNGTTIQKDSKNDTTVQKDSQK